MSEDSNSIEANALFMISDLKSEIGGLRSELFRMNSELIGISKDTKDIEDNTATLGRQVNQTTAKAIAASFATVTLVAALAGIYGYGTVTDAFDSYATNVDNQTREFEQRVNETARQLTGKLETLESEMLELTEQSSILYSSLEDEIRTLQTTARNLGAGFVEVSTEMTVISDQLAEFPRVFAEQVTTLQQDTTELSSEILSLTAQVRELSVGSRTNSRNAEVALTSGTANDLIIELRTAMVLEDAQAISRLVPALSALEDSLTLGELATLATGAYRVRLFDAAASAARVGIQKFKEIEQPSSTEVEEVSSLYARRADIFAENGKIDEAVMQYSECIDLVPNSEQCHNNLSGLYFDQGRFDRACAILEPIYINASGQDRFLIGNNLGLCLVSHFFTTEGNQKEVALRDLSLLSSDLEDLARNDRSIGPQTLAEVLFVRALSLGLNGDEDAANALLQEASENDNSLILLGAGEGIAPVLSNLRGISEDLASSQSQ